MCFDLFIALLNVFNFLIESPCRSVLFTTVLVYFTTLSVLYFLNLHLLSSLLADFFAICKRCGRILGTLYGI